MKTKSGQNYNKWGSGEKILVALHGWPGNSLKWESMAKILAKDFTIYALDMAGWGETPLTRAYFLEDYAQDIKQFLIDLKIEKPVLIGHSFGGRVAIKFAVENPNLIEQLILAAAAGIERKSLKVKMLRLLSKFLPDFLKKNTRRFFSSKDYVALIGDKKETFINVVNENLESLLPKITTPTLLIWGREDHTTPLWQGKLMHKLIPHSKLTVISGANHGLTYRAAGEVAERIRKFEI